MTRILIATNEPILARGFEAILAGRGFRVVEICSDFTQLMESFRKCQPEIAIVDLPATVDVGMIRELRRRSHRCQILLWARALSQDQADEAIRLGARGVLPNNVAPARLLEALELLASFPAPEPTTAVLVSQICTANERKLLELVGHGMRNNEIAREMRSDESTVGGLLKSLAFRLGAQDRYELVLYGLSTVNEAL